MKEPEINPKDVIIRKPELRKEFGGFEWFIALFLLIALVLATSCSFTDKNRGIEEVTSFDIHKYKGYKIVSQVPDDWSDVEIYIIRNDSCAVELKVPSWFSTVYSVGDSIK
jgi:hypothetical protein